MFGSEQKCGQRIYTEATGTTEKDEWDSARSVLNIKVFRAGSRLCYLNKATARITATAPTSTTVKIYFLQSPWALSYPAKRKESANITAFLLDTTIIIVISGGQAPLIQHQIMITSYRKSLWYSLFSELEVNLDSRYFI